MSNNRPTIAALKARLESEREKLAEAQSERITSSLVDDSGENSKPGHYTIDAESFDKLIEDLDKEPSEAIKKASLYTETETNAIGGTNMSQPDAKSIAERIVNADHTYALWPPESITLARAYLELERKHKITDLEVIENLEFELGKTHLNKELINDVSRLELIQCLLFWKSLIDKVKDESNLEINKLKEENENLKLAATKIPIVKFQTPLNSLSASIHQTNVNAGWWTDLETGELCDRNVGELLCLVHSEISEAMEGYRKDLMDDKLPHRKSFEVELVDALIRIFDIAGKFRLDLDGAMQDKLEYNAKRADHKLENRKGQNGKRF